MAEVKFLIEGIVCTGCALDMENILLGLDGVNEASINFREGLLSMRYDPEEIALESIIKKVKKLGFPVQILTEDN